ncbi:hypothetical protein [Pandoraea sp. NPDC090278]|uniref:hypothetical protein n=1 Tax=Pandoraea sp. NPDC090278 TaxID=3364391 RepID=UPI00383A65A8
MLELRASLQFAAHDESDYENGQKSGKKQRQQHVVSGAVSAKRVAPKPATKREYLNSAKTNRQHEVAMQNVLRARLPEEQQDLVTREREAVAKHRSQMRSRRNSVVALRRTMTKPEET